MTGRKSSLVSGGAALVLAASVGVAAAQELRRDLGSYFIFANRSLSGKNLRLLSPCNVGVNCAQPTTNSSCGTISFEDAFFADGSQLAGDKGNFNKAFADAFQAFLNKGGPFPNLIVRQPPVQSFVTPIIPGTCDGACNPDVAAIDALCGVPNPFPSCDPTKLVQVSAGGDCEGAPDASPGNGQCDLGPGTYGDVNVKNNAKISFTGGVYDVCSLILGKNADGSAASAATINVDDGGAFRVNNASNFGSACGEFTVNVKGKGVVSFGRNASIAAKVCASASDVNLGHGNDLLGQFVGDTVTANRDNDGRCCGGACTCFDEFSPSSAKAGDNVTLTSGCDLNSATAVKVCGVDAPIVTKTANQLVFTVPNVPPGPCPIDLESVVGSYRAFATLTVTP